MPVSDPSDDDVRTRAYQLWEAGGRVDGRDLDDWSRAKTLLLQEGRHDALASPIQHAAEPSLATGMIFDSVATMAALATGAAQAFTSLFGPHDTPKRTD